MLPLSIYKTEKQKSKKQISPDVFYQKILKIIGLESKRDIVSIIEDSVDSELKKELVEELTDNMFQVYYINPEEF